jgi:hypothetical protein
MPDGSRHVPPSFALVALLLASACAPVGTMATVIDEKEKGAAVVYPIGPDRAWELAVDVLRRGGANAIEEHRDQHYLLTSTSPSPTEAGVGAYVGIWIQATDAHHPMVTCVMRWKKLTSLPGPLTEKRFHVQLQRALGSGSPGQVIRPDAQSSWLMPAPSRDTCNRDSDCDEGICFEERCRRQ